MSNVNDGAVAIINNEIDFINGLGSFSDKTGMTRRQLLSAYLKALQNREEWCGMDRAEIISLVMEALSVEVSTNGTDSAIPGLHVA